MSWRRTDDGYEEHPKILELIAQAGYEAFYRLGKIHGYCARNRTNGTIPKPALKELGVTPKMLAAMIETGLIDESDDGTLNVHDWRAYNPTDPTNAERQARHRNGKRNAESNGNRNGANNGPHAGASAPDPVPYPKNNSPQQSVEAPPRANTAKNTATRTSDLEHLPNTTHTPSHQPITLIDRLLILIGDHADPGTQGVLTAYARKLPDAPFAMALEALREDDGSIEDRAAFVVSVLKTYGTAA